MPAVKVKAEWSGNIDDTTQRKLDSMTARTVAVLDDLGTDAVMLARGLAPVASGAYVGGLTSRRNVIGRRMGVDVRSTVPHAHVVEAGRKPGKMPLASDLMGKLGIDRTEAFLIGRRIGRKGTKGARVIKRTRATMKGRLASEAVKLGAWLNDLDAH